MADFEFELRTTALPTIRATDDELTAPGDGAAPWWGTWLKPKVIVHHPFGVWTSAPYGEPGETTWPLLAVVGGVGALVMLGLMFAGLRSLFRR